MNIQDIKNNFIELDYCYIYFPLKEVIIEFSDVDTAKAYARGFGGIFCDHFPYQELGFEDPYEFTNEWLLINEDAETVSYVFAETSMGMTVVEVTKK